MKKPTAVDIKKIKKIRPPSNSLTKCQMNIIEKSLKRKEEVYVFELRHNNRKKSIYEVSIETVISNNEYYYISSISPTLLDETSPKMQPKYHNFLNGTDNYYRLMNDILARFIIAQQNYIEYDL